MREWLQPRSRAPVRLTFLRLAFAAGLFASAHAAAQEYPARDVGGWTVAASKDERGCFITREYGGEGETTLLLGLDIDGTNHLSVLNYNWSIKPKARLELNFRLSKVGYPKHFAVGMASHGKKGFVTNFEAKFPTYFAASRFLHIYRGDVPVEQLSLEGSGAAVAELRRCVAIYTARTTIGPGERERSARIPRDPFASDAEE
jgi:hypothetical protein